MVGVTATCDGPSRQEDSDLRRCLARDHRLAGARGNDDAVPEWRGSVRRSPADTSRRCMARRGRAQISRAVQCSATAE
jgi:hypothetical protein